jgi:solute carrier family 8 (sodium/calcium exchanger)
MYTAEAWACACSFNGDSHQAHHCYGCGGVSQQVNVFLGLGIPWVLATFWKGGSYQVPAGDLAYSVIIYTACAMVCIAMLLLRRLDMFGGAELGGSTMAKRGCAVFLVGLWLVYIGLSAAKSEA